MAAFGTAVRRGTEVVAAIGALISLASTGQSAGLGHRNVHQYNTPKRAANRDDLGHAPPAQTCEEQCEIESGEGDSEQS